MPASGEAGMHKARTWNSLVNNERKVGGDTNMMKYLQKLGKALMLPVAALPVAGILMGVGYLLAPAVMGAAGDTTGFAYTAGFLLIKAGGALIDNMAWLFAVGAAVGLADDHDGTAGLAGLVAFLMIQQLLNPAVVGTIRGMDADAQTAWLATTEGIAFSKIAGNSFIGILAAIAIPQYQTYVAKSQVARAMEETGALKTAYEDCLNNGQTAAQACNMGATKSNIINFSNYNYLPKLSIYIRTFLYSNNSCCNVFETK